MAKLSSCNKDCKVHKAENIYYPHQKKVVSDLQVSLFKVGIQGPRVPLFLVYERIFNMMV